MRRMIVVALFAVGLLIGSSGVAEAGKSCPKGTRFEGGRAGGVCIGLDSGLIEKTIRN